MNQRTVIFSLLVVLALSACSVAGYPGYYDGHDDSSYGFPDESCEFCDDSSEEIHGGTGGATKPEPIEKSSTTTSTTIPVAETTAIPGTETTAILGTETTTLDGGKTTTKPSASDIQASITATVQVIANVTSLSSG